MPNGYEKTAAAFAVAVLCWHRAIFPVRRQTSIVATDELNFRVRNGNGWTLVVIDTNFVEIRFAHSISAGSLRLPSKTAYRFAVSPLQHETAFHVGLRENEVQDSNSLHTQNRTKGTSEARLLSLRFIEPMKVKPSGY